MPDTPSTSSLPWGAGLNANSTYDLATKVAAATVSLTPSVAGSSPAGSIAASQGYYSTIASATNSLGVGAGIQQGVLAALPVGFKNSVSQLSDFRLGTFLNSQGKVNGNTASLINGAIQFVKNTGNNTIGSPTVPTKPFQITSNFVPVIITSEFNLSNTGTAPAAFSVIFDSTPENISLTKGSNWTPKDFYGRPEPIQIFATSGAVSFSLTGTFFASDSASLQARLSLEKQLFALVTPSKNHFMPSPVKVKIGNWKSLRCIVSNISINYKGPWYIPPSVSNTPASGTTTSGALTSNQLPIASPNISSHSPYVFEVTFNFTVTSQSNTVQYAEDMVDYGYNYGYPSTGSLIANNSPSLTSMTGTSIQGNLENGANTNMVNQANTMIYNPNNGTITYNILGVPGQVGTNATGRNVIFNTAAYLQTLGLPTTPNNSAQQNALGAITSGLSGITQTAITKNLGPSITRIFGK